MNDVARVLSWFADGRLLRPRPDQVTSVHLARALAGLCGVELESEEGSGRVAAAVGEAEHYVFVLADGLGMNLVEGRAESSFLRRRLAMEMRSVFPSSTAPALTSLATGAWPAEHGLAGWFVHLPERGINAIGLPFVERASGRPLEELGLGEGDVFRQAALLSGYRRDVLSLMPTRITDSVYTRYVCAGTPVTGYESLSGAVDAVIERVRDARSATFTYVYYPRVDSAQHAHGPSAPQTRREVDLLDAELSRLADALDGGARVVVSADHGLFDINAAAKLFVEAEDELMALLLGPPSGEPRVPLLHVRPSREGEAASLFRRRFGDHFALLTTNEVDDLRLLGPSPLSAEARSRLGDFLALSAAGEVLVFRPEKQIAAMKGFHGGLMADEVRIPLIVA